MRERPRPRWPAVLAWGLWALMVVGFGALLWLDQLLRQTGRRELVVLSDFAVLVPAAVSAATVGAVVAARRSRHPVGWLLLVLGLSVTAGVLATAYSVYGLVVRPGTLPAAASAAAYAGGSWIVFPACVGLVLLLTPTGSLPSPRWRWWVTAVGVAPAAYLLAGWLRADPSWAYAPQPYWSMPNPIFDAALAPWFVLVQLGVVTGGASLVVRFRRARGVERQQVRWMAVAAFLAGVSAVIVLFGVVVGDPRFYVNASVGYVVVLPLIVGAAVLRYRLYDLDRIISRTLAYGLLTVLLGLGYALVVLGLGAVVGQGADSSLAVAGATLAVAAVFRPARRRVQELVDRRFNRRRYDAERTIAAFSGRLRQQTDLDALTAELLAVVDQTMQPTRAALWLRPAAARPPLTQGAAAQAGGVVRVPG